MDNLEYHMIIDEILEMVYFIYPIQETIHNETNLFS